MRRRDFLKVAATCIIGGGLLTPDAMAEITIGALTTKPESYDDHIKDYLHKMKDFDRHHDGDVILSKEKFRILESCVRRFKRLQTTVGHGNFYLLSFDDALRFARNYSQIEPFTKVELDFLEKMFYTDGARYGFYGNKPLDNLTHKIDKRATVKIIGAGNYIYKGRPLATYYKIKKEIGDEIVLTSGVRGLVKQFYLFLNKAYKSKGNLSIASRSLAPPGYSYHGISDFDVGQSGLGWANFSRSFTTTDVFKKLEDLSYVSLRYPQNNLLGVRFEPWHIKVTSHS